MRVISSNQFTSDLLLAMYQTPNNAYPIFNPNGTYGGNVSFTNNLYAQASSAHNQRRICPKAAGSWPQHGNYSTVRLCCHSGGFNPNGTYGGNVSFTNNLYAQASNSGYIEDKTKDLLGMVNLKYDFDQYVRGLSRRHNG